MIFNEIEYIWRPHSLSKLTPYQIQPGLTHLDSEASSSYCILRYKNAQKMMQGIMKNTSLQYPIHTIRYCWSYI